jgi:hypothetical protein
MSAVNVNPTDSVNKINRDPKYNNVLGRGEMSGITSSPPIRWTESDVTHLDVVVEMEGVAPSSDMATLHKVFQTKYISNLRFSIDGSKFANHSNHRNTNYRQGQHFSDPSMALIGYLSQKHVIKCNQHESGVTRLTLTTIKINHDYAACGTPSKIRLTRELAKSRSELN